MTRSPGLLLTLLVFSSLGCGVAGAQGDSDEVAMSGGTGERVLGKRAFDAASAGYPRFERLLTEAPRGTVRRAADRLDVLARDLALLQSRGGVDAADFGRAAALLDDSRGAVAGIERGSEAGVAIDEAALGELVTKVAGLQVALDGLRERHVRGR